LFVQLTLFLPSFPGPELAFFSSTESCFGFSSYRVNLKNSYYKNIYKLSWHLLVCESGIIARFTETKLRTDND
jgi:hypothetical protein